jgi:hypothetical protein
MHLEALNERGKEIFPRLKNFTSFYLAGGTALALQIGHRISFDFDFFSSDSIVASLLSEVESVFTDKKVRLLVSNRDELTVEINDVKVTFLKYPFPTLQEFVIYEGTRFLSVPELAATKAYTIGRRGSYRDYIDLHAVLSEKRSSLSEIIDLAERKYGESFNARLFLEQLVYLKDVEDTAIMFLGQSIGKEEVENFFETEVKNIKL